MLLCGISLTMRKAFDTPDAPPAWPQTTYEQSTNFRLKPDNIAMTPDTYSFRQATYFLQIIIGWYPRIAGCFLQGNVALATMQLLASKHRSKKKQTPIIELESL